MNSPYRSLPSSDHFELIELASGVYAAIATPGGAAASNAGIIDLGDRTLIFDTFETPLAAYDLQTAADAITGRTADWVIISHAHLDHWLGNQVFADYASILTTHQTRIDMYDFAEDAREMIANPAELEESIQQAKAQLEAETNPLKREALVHTIAHRRYKLEMLPTLELQFPTQTFDGCVTFYGSTRTAALHSTSQRHTASDCYLVLPDEKISFIGDLGFFQCQPYMPDCQPFAWIEQLDALQHLEIEIFIPGHGPVGTKADLALQARYIAILEHMVAEVISEGGTEKTALQQTLPTPFDTWQIEGYSRFEANVSSAYERLSRQ